MTASSPSASVIVLTYNARDFIADCLDALFQQTYATFEVIVVDNASSDGTAGFVREHYSNARVVCSPTNTGYGAGNNVGVAYASGEILVFLNPDAVPGQDWLSHLIQCMQQHGRQFATSQITLLSDPERLNSGGNSIHYLGLSFCRGLNARRSAYGKVELVSGASGAACAISRALFDRIGGFDPSFFLYHDDVDLSIRALLAGERILYVPDAVVSHDYEFSVAPDKWGWIESQRYAVLLKVFRFRTLLLLLPALLAIEILTFTYLAARGPAFIAAKIGTYGWLIRNAAGIRDGRRRAQAVRVFSDRQILDVLADQIPYEQLASPEVALLAHWLVDPWFRAYHQLMLTSVRW